MEILLREFVRTPYIGNSTPLELDGNRIYDAILLSEENVISIEI